MQEFVKKLIERLEENLGNTNFEKATKEVNESFYEGMASAYGEAIEIINQLAEEYTQTIDVAELVEKFGTDTNVPSNAERIRAMNDEELENHIIHSGFCPASVQKESCYHSDDDSECSECIKKWLQSEVEQ